MGQAMQQTSVVLVILAVALFAFGLYGRRRWATRGTRHIQQTTGQVVDKQADDLFIGEASKAIILTIHFITNLGQPCEFQVRQIWEVNSEGWEEGTGVGDTVNVYYNPAFPERAAIGFPSTSTSLFPISFMVGGVVCLILGILLFAAAAAA